MRHLFQTLCVSGLLILCSAVTSRAQFDGCGDANQNNSITIADATLLHEYLFNGGPAPDSLALMNIDGRPGITITDLSFLLSCILIDWQWHEGCNLCRDTLNYDTSPGDIVYLRNPEIPPGAGQHVAEIWLQPEEGIRALSFPFNFSCSTSAVAVDSVVFHSLPNIGQDYTKEYLVDSAGQTAVVAASTLWYGMTEKARLASIYFAVFPKPFEQTIVIDTTTSFGSQTYAAHIHSESTPFNGEVVRPMLYGTPTTEAHPPSCCQGETGDLDANGSVTLSDLTQMVNFLFVNFEPITCYPEANMYGDDKCYLNLSDLTQLVNKLFLTFQPVDQCDQFDNFICGQFY